MHLFWISGCAACTLLMATDGPQIDWPLNILVQEHYWETRKLGIQSNKPFPFLLFILLYSPSEGWFTIAPWIVDGMVYHCGSLIYDPQAWEMTLCEPRPVGSAQLAVETTAWRNVLMLQAEILGLECHLAAKFSCNPYFCSECSDSCPSCFNSTCILGQGSNPADLTGIFKASSLEVSTVSPLRRISGKSIDCHSGPRQVWPDLSGC